MGQSDSLNDGRIQPDDEVHYTEAEYDEAARNAAITINTVVHQRQELIECLLRVIRDPRRGGNIAGEMLRKIKAKEGVWA